MKPFILSLLLLLNIMASGQSLSPDVIAAGGAYFQSAGFGSLSWTLGEPATETLGDGIIFTQGFHQVFDDLVYVPYGPETSSVLDLFPNPADGFITLRIAPLPVKAYLVIADLAGRTLLTADLCHEDQRLDVSRLPAGTYLLTARASGFRIPPVLIVILHP